MNSLFPQQEIEDILKNHFTGISPDHRLEISLDFLKDVEIRDDDVFLIGNAKSGTTWLQELVWLVGNDLDYEGANTFIDKRFPFLESQGYVKEGVLEVTAHMDIQNCHLNSLNYIQNLKSPRFIKTHAVPKCLPTQLLSGTKKAKIIYISRNTRDVCLSSYYYTKNVVKVHDCSLDDFCKVFISNDNHFESILYFWNAGHQENVLFVRYEEMKNDLGEVIQRVAKFLNKTVTDEQQSKLLKWLDIDQMKLNKAVNHETMYQATGFIRKGIVGGYKQEMSPEILEKFKIWIRESLKDSDYFECE
ncbi:sulfotransferase 1E1-like isoform X1 [Photinus pyralis]|uniref:sulfotransferase 1E1-like isoform X1 n=1 Tax=Photinus pyralis TaxID=7054 RepID=UPI001266FE7F|nr:sulfotransferase 1E1-like isoform X1 [Photinus pyralis]